MVQEACNKLKSKSYLVTEIMLFPQYYLCFLKLVHERNYSSGANERKKSKKIKCNFEPRHGKKPSHPFAGRSVRGIWQGMWVVAFLLDKLRLSIGNISCSQHCRHTASMAFQGSLGVRHNIKFAETWVQVCIGEAQIKSAVYLPIPPVQCALCFCLLSVLSLTASTSGQEWFLLCLWMMPLQGF